MDNLWVIIWGVLLGIVLVTLCFWGLMELEKRLLKNQRKRYNFRNKAVIITGASSGLGKCLAVKLAEKKARLFLVARRENLLRDVALHCCENGALSVDYFVGDVSQTETNRMMVDKCIKSLGKLDVLFLNVGMSSNSSFVGMDEEEVEYHRELFDVNFWAYVEATNHALPYLQDSKGVIVAVSSMATRAYCPRRALYAASKSAVNSFFNNLRTEVSKFKINVMVALIGTSALQTAKMSADCAQKILESVESCDEKYQAGTPFDPVGSAPWHQPTIPPQPKPKREAGGDETKQTSEKPKQKGGDGGSKQMSEKPKHEKKD